MNGHPSHHPSHEMLLDYASGSMTDGRALIISAHLAFCPACRSQVAAAESVGGEILETEPGADVASQVDPAVPVDRGQPAVGIPDDGRFSFAPRQLRQLLAKSESNWVNVWFGVKELPIPGYSPAARLLRIPASRRMPRHDHFGEEMTLVLKGSFSDSTGRFSVGDLQVGMPGLDHQPHAGPEGECVCLVVEQGGLKLSGWLGRLVEWRGGRAEPKAA